jgi:hypothetical protein
MEAYVNIWKRALIIGLLMLMTAPALAQDTDVETVAPINVDDIVEDTLTQKAFFDWWQVQAVEGDILVIDMAASGGLQPLIGILDIGGNLAARSPDGAADSTVTLEYIVPATGQYVIVATRVGNLDGTTTGTYNLRLRRANAPIQESNPYQDVTFRCEDYEVTTAATLVFQEDPTEGLSHRITVYGMDGFQPVIRLNVNVPNRYELCNTDARRAIGDTFTLPGEETHSISEANLNTVSQLLVNGADDAGIITITIGSKDGQPGRYMVIVDGLSIEPSADVDAYEVRVGPLAAENSAIQLYMIDAENSRLDPFLTRSDTEETCDDAGRKGCEAVLSFTGAGATLNEGSGATFVGDRSDAGLLLNPGNPDPMIVETSSRDGRTHGGYALVLIGELPPREAS